MLTVYNSYWSWPSVIFYIILGLMAVWALRKVYVEKWDNENEVSSPQADKYILFVAFVWTFFATFRLLGYGIGGKDAAAYRMFFEDCLNPVYTDWMEHVAGDYGYLWINKLLRTCTDNYHVFFAMAYGLIAWAFINFVKEYMPKQISYAPFILAIFPFWLGLNTLRSTLATAILMLAMIAVGENKWIKAIIITICAVLVHKMIAVYALFLLFCWVYRKRDIKVYQVVLMIVLSSVIAKLIQPWFIQYSEEVDLSGAYGAYARMSLENDFTDNFWKIAFEQMVLGAAMVVYNKRIQSMIADEEDEDYKWKIRTVWLMCAFDMIMIPVSYIMNIWRAYEIFYMPRIVMWAWLIGFVVDQKFSHFKLLFDYGALFLMIVWMTFRMNRIYAASWLMPYVFDWQFFSIGS